MKAGGIFGTSSPPGALGADQDSLYEQFAKNCNYQGQRAQLPGQCECKPYGEHPMLPYWSGRSIVCNACVAREGQRPEKFSRSGYIATTCPDEAKNLQRPVLACPPAGVTLVSSPSNLCAGDYGLYSRSDGEKICAKCGTYGEFLTAATPSDTVARSAPSTPPSTSLPPSLPTASKGSTPAERCEQECGADITSAQTVTESQLRCFFNCAGLTENQLKLSIEEFRQKGRLAPEPSVPPSAPPAEAPGSPSLLDQWNALSDEEKSKYAMAGGLVVFGIAAIIVWKTML